MAASHDRAKPQKKFTKASFEMYGKIVRLDYFDLPPRKLTEALETRDFLLFGTRGEKCPVVLFALTERDELIVVKHFRFGANKWVYELPGGTASMEGLKETTLAELREETGFETTAKNIRKCKRKYWFDPASSDVQFIPVFVRDCKVWENKPEVPKEREEYIKPAILFEKENWFESIMNGKITDSKSIVTTFAVLNEFGDQLSGWKKAAKKLLGSNSSRPKR